MADTRFLLFHKGGALFVAPPPSPFDSPATSYKLALGRGPLGFAPPLRRGCAFIAAPERQRLQMIVLAWGRPTYRPHGHFSQPMQARLYARWRFLGRELRRTPSLRSSVAGTSSILCMQSYEPSTLYIRQSAV